MHFSPRWFVVFAFLWIMGCLRLGWCQATAVSPQANRAIDRVVASQSEIQLAVAAGNEYLLSQQNRSGSWGGPQWTGGVDSDPVPGAFRSFEIAVTAMCLEALLDTPESWVEDVDRMQTARRRACDYLLDRTETIRRAGPGDLPNIWANCYCIQTFAKLHRRSDDEDERRVLAEAIKQHQGGLERWQSIHGGWFYYGSGMYQPANPSCSFVNSAILVALARARDAGFLPDPRMVERAVKATRLMRKPDSSYLYSLRIPTDKAVAMREINRPAGSLGRSQAGNIALRLWPLPSDQSPLITDEVLKQWLDRMVHRHGWLDMGRKRPIPHESFAAVAGYFYYFGVYYAACCIEVLPAADQLDYQQRLSRIIIDRQESDGSWFDYPLYRYHKPYGTAFALLSLRKCQPDISAP